ncbi:MAG TPA: 50S ribosomal protein L24 [Candidatus Marinimicrobia bacterium]|jgi:large subunit ribosomal protein L24|nr:50S ribosomal protein L24 [Candidatus Neomarinimicrobiota bacterium]HIC51142.1 50S ribosomal protein L24 [Candidatus Neomarinimicrobiota bacterium]
MHIKKGDTVKILSGAYKGKTGKVLFVLPKRNRAIVESVNFVKRHSRPTQQNPQGGIVEKEASIHVSNLAVVADGKATRVGYRFLDTGRKVRVSRKTGEDIDS